jgi:hypothetical protein
MIRKNMGIRSLSCKDRSHEGENTQPFQRFVFMLFFLYFAPSFLKQLTLFVSIPISSPSADSVGEYLGQAQ